MNLKIYIVPPLFNGIPNPLLPLLTVACFSTDFTSFFTSLSSSSLSNILGSECEINYSYHVPKIAHKLFTQQFSNNKEIFACCNICTENLMIQINMGASLATPLARYLLQQIPH